MELTAEQEADVWNLCKEIRPGEYVRVAGSFVSEPSNLVQITGEKNCRFHNEKAEPTSGNLPTEKDRKILTHDGGKRAPDHPSLCPTSVKPAQHNGQLPGTHGCGD